MGFWIFKFLTCNNNTDERIIYTAHVQLIISLNCDIVKDFDLMD
jgi:hypothetical protein